MSCSYTWYICFHRLFDYSHDVVSVNTFFFFLLVLKHRLCPILYSILFVWISKWRIKQKQIYIVLGCTWFDNNVSKSKVYVFVCIFSFSFSNSCWKLLKACWVKPQIVSFANYGIAVSLLLWVCCVGELGLSPFSFYFLGLMT